MRDYNRNVRRLIEVADKLIVAADKGHSECQDDKCLSLFGLAKDCGYRIRMAAELEYLSHEAKFGPVNKNHEHKMET